MTQFHGAPKVGQTQTIDVETSTVVLYDLASAEEALGVIDDRQVFALLLLLARGTSSSNFARFQRICSFSRLSGTIEQLGAPVIVGVDYTAGLPGTAPTLDFDTTTIRGRGTGLSATTINWTGYLWLYTGD